MFGCDEYGIWFYVIIGGIVAVVLGVGAVVIIKFKKSRMPKTSQMTG